MYCQFYQKSAKIIDMSNNNNKSSAKKNNKMSSFKFDFNLRNILIFLVGTLLVFYLFNSLTKDLTTDQESLPISTVVQDIKDNKVKAVELDGNKLTATYNDNKKVTSTKESSTSFTEILKDYGVDPKKVKVYKVNDATNSSNLINLLANVIPAILTVAFLVFIFRQAKGAQDSVFSFGQAKVKRFTKDMPKVSFSNVAGVDEAKKELEEVVDFLKHPEKYKKLGARTPKGVMLVGPAGCGKTLLAKAVAGEAGVPFISIAGSEFMEMLVGIGAARARDLFMTAKKSAPSIIFIDEIDAIGRARSTGVMPSHDEREQTLNQILVEMDGFAPTEQVVVIAATNRGDLLDPALLRPGRFDRRIIVDYPDLEGRKEIIKIHARNKPFEDNVSWERIAKRTVGFSGADLENMLNEAAIYAARAARDKINMNDIEEAALKVKLGPEKTRLQSDYDKRLTAYHEAGHAIVSHFMPHTDPVHRISIVSRGMALGYTLIPPEKDKVHETKTHLIERMAVMMGGRAAEELVFNEVTTGAANDFDQATNVAKAMVMEYGMSKLGPVNFGPTQDITEWGKTLYEQNTISQEMLGAIDREIKEFLDLAYKNAQNLLSKNRAMLDKVAEELLKKETMDSDEFEKIVGTKHNGAKVAS
jgi:cell division protease FtsH